MGEELIQFRVAQLKSTTYPWLVWCGTASPTLVATRPASPAEVSTPRLNALSEEVVRKALASSSECSGLDWSLGQTMASVVDGTTLVATTPVKLKSGDSRGYVFQVVDLAGGKLLWQAFGHPEWSSSATEIREVSAQMFFRLKNQGEVFMLGNYGAGWESTASAVYRPRTGSVVSIAP